MSDLQHIFQSIKNELAKFSSEFSVNEDNADSYSLWTKRKIKLGRYDRPMFFAQVIARKNSASLHFFPIYMNEPLLAKVPAVLKKYLTGKTCFTITKDDPVIYSDVAILLGLGLKAYQDRGWV